MQLFHLFLFGSVASASVLHKRVEDCGGQPYNYGDYTCYYGNKLCPIRKDPYEATLPCGKDCFFDSAYNRYAGKLCPKPTALYICENADGTWACFDPLKYTCENGKLAPKAV